MRVIAHFFEQLWHPSARELTPQASERERQVPHRDYSIDEDRADLEARFRELEAEEQIERLRRGQRPGEAARSTGGDQVADPLAEMKSQFERDAAKARSLLVICPHCGAKNRTRLSRLREAEPLCGACGQALAS